MSELHNVDETDISLSALHAVYIVAMHRSASSASFSCDNRRASLSSRTRLPKTMRGSGPQGKDNVLLLFPLPTQAVSGEREKVRCRERLGGLLKYYEREAA